MLQALLTPSRAMLYMVVRNRDEIDKINCNWDIWIHETLESKNKARTPTQTVELELKRHS